MLLSNVPPSGQMPPASLTQPPAPAPPPTPPISASPPNLPLQNQSADASASPSSVSYPQKDPLRILESGPLPPEELISLQPWSLWPDLSSLDAELTLSNLQARQGHLLPQWWKGSPEQFNQAFSERTPPDLWQRSTLARKQQDTLQILLSMLQEARSYTPTPQP